MSDPVPQRIGDADRDQAADCLREHLAQGRLTQDEFDERLSTALSARTAADLEPLFSDLPDPRPGFMRGIQPMTSPWPSYPDRQGGAGLPTPRPATPPPASTSNQNQGLATVAAVATAVAWPVWLLASFATNWRLWWLIFIPIVISAAAGAMRRQGQ